MPHSQDIASGRSPGETGHTLRADDGVDLTYWRHCAPAARGTLLLLHGAASNHTRWSEFLSLTRLTQEWNTLRPDLRGHGRSLYRGPVSMARWCADLAQLLDAERCARAVLVGHSLGANLALNFARRFPRRAAALILIDPAHPETLHLAVPRAIVRTLVSAAAAATLALNAVGFHRRALHDLDLAQLDRQARALLAQQRDAEMERLYSSTREDLKYTPTATYLQDIANVLQPLPLPPSTLPVMLLLSVGRDDAAIRSNRAFAARMPNCHVVEIACNHWILTAAPEAARAAIEGWSYFD